MIGTNTTQTPRRCWDPVKTDLVEDILTRLVEKYRRGDLCEEIRPMTLLNEGGDFSAFYKAAFSFPAEWSLKRFPRGWQSFVEELNSRLRADGISIIDTKRDVQGTAWLPERERDLIRSVAEAYKKGEIASREEAVALLTDTFGLALSPGKLRYYLDEHVPRPASPEDAKEKLIARIDKLKKDLAVDLSIAACIRGHVFEKFVGVVLRSLNPAGPIIAQKCLELPYKDFSGKRHSLLYLDWVTGQDSVEAKYRNSIEKILESAMPQAIALGHKQNVVYRHPCEEMLFMFESNLRMDDTLEALGLLHERTRGKRIKDFINYIPIERLIDCSPEAALLTDILTTLDASLAGAAPTRLWQWAEGLGRIAASAEQLPQRLAVFARAVAEGRDFSRSELTRLFGSAPETAVETEEQGMARRLAIILRERSSARDRLLLAVYNKHFHEKNTELTSAQVEALGRLAENDFNDAALDVLAEMDARRRERELMAKHVDPLEDMHRTIAVFERIERRRLADRYRDADELYDRCQELIEHALAKADAAYAPSNEVRKHGMLGGEEMWALIQRHSKGTGAGKVDDFSRQAAHFCAERFDKIHQSLYTDFCRVLAKQVMTTGASADQGWNIDPDTSRLSGLVSTIQGTLERHRRTLSSLPYVAACLELNRKARSGKLPLSPRAKAALNRLAQHYDLGIERTMLTIADTIVKIVENHAACLPGQGFDMMRCVLEGRGGRQFDALGLFQVMLMNAADGNMQLMHCSLLGIKHEGECLQAVRDGRALPDLLLPDLDKLEIVQVGKNRRFLLSFLNPRRSYAYFSAAAPLWSKDTMKPALNEAERYLWRDRAQSWECAVKTVAAAVNGARIELPGPIDPDEPLVSIEVGEPYFRPIRTCEFTSEQMGSAMRALEHTLVAQHLLSCDLWSRRVSQARRIACLTPDLAREFLASCVQHSPDPTLSLERCTNESLSAMRISDADYEGLVV